MDRIEWHGLYAESWGNDLVPEAYAHPAKYSRGLIRQIYAYMLAEGMIAPGDVIGDPFGGQAGGALDAMINGLHWRGVELEPRFVD
ncbi:MAG: site-specific DNA-methyltransferase, partial [Chloroflexi bacterium]|nr:site-specific DNA-methyltransferase [Chloroflexota bacterium]